MAAKGGWKGRFSGTTYPVHAVVGEMKTSPMFAMVMMQFGRGWAGGRLVVVEMEGRAGAVDDGRMGAALMVGMPVNCMG